MKFNTPWRAVSDTEAESLAQELARELPRHHALDGLIVRALARRCDRDDVLFRIAEERFAVVHLTWRPAREEDRAWPSCELYESISDLQLRLQRDHADVSQ